MRIRTGTTLAVVLGATAIVRAQPPSDDDTAPQTGPPGPPARPPDQIGSEGPAPLPQPQPPLTGEELDPGRDPYEGQPVPPTEAPTIPDLPVRRPRRGPIDLPEVLTTPTGWLLPAAVLYSRTSLDTGGGVTSDTRVGLGDVAEFGIASTDAVRERLDRADKRPSRIQPYVTASFRLGLGEDRLFKGQPGFTLGFRKSFERNHDGYSTRIAELTLVASKKVGRKVAFHVGGAFWDASLAGYLSEGAAERTEVTLHDGDVAEQVQVFGGVQFQPLPRSQILVDLGWAPEFCYLCPATEDKITLRPTLSWGVRYAVADFMNLEAGVRVPDIADANLLDAQIFGQITFVSWALRRAVDTLK